MRRLELLVLPDGPSSKITTEGQTWAFFRDWPEGSYHFDWIDPWVVPAWSRWVEGRLLKSFVLQSLRAFFSGRRYDAVIAHGSRSIMALGWLHRLMGRKHPKLVVFDIESFGRVRSGLRLRLVRRATEPLDAVIFHARAQADYYAEYLPHIRERAFYVPLGFGAADKRLSWEGSGRDDHVLTLGTTAPGRRDWATLVRALERLDEAPRVRVVGASELPRPLPPSIQVLPRMAIADLRLAMERCRLAVLPLTERGHAHGQLTLFDLMASGAAVIVSDTSGVRDYVKDGDNALLYESGDAEALAATMRWALDHDDERRAIGRRAHDWVRRELDPDLFSRRVYDVVSGLFDA